MKICNTIVGLKTNRSIDLEKFCSKNTTACKYNPHRFPGLSFKIMDPKTTILVFKTGNLVCTGAKTIEDAYDSLRKVLDLLNFPLKLVEFAQVHNYVGTGSIDHDIDLHKVYKMCSLNAVYEAEIFPGLVYKFKKHRVTVLIFPSGKFVITGSRYLGDLSRSELGIQIMLKNCLK